MQTRRHNWVIFKRACVHVSRVSNDMPVKRVFNQVFVFSTNLEEKQKLNDRSIFRKRKIAIGNYKTFNY